MKPRNKLLLSGGSLLTFGLLVIDFVKLPDGNPPAIAIACTAIGALCLFFGMMITFIEWDDN